MNGTSLSQEKKLSFSVILSFYIYLFVRVQSINSGHFLQFYCVLRFWCVRQREKKTKHAIKKNTLITVIILLYTSCPVTSIVLGKTIHTYPIIVKVDQLKFKRLFTTAVLNYCYLFYFYSIRFSFDGVRAGPNKIFDRRAQ